MAEPDHAACDVSPVRTGFPEDPQGWRPMQCFGFVVLVGDSEQSDETVSNAWMDRPSLLTAWRERRELVQPVSGGQAFAIILCCAAQLGHCCYGSTANVSRTAAIFLGEKRSRHKGIEAVYLSKLYSIHVDLCSSQCWSQNCVSSDSLCTVSRMRFSGKMLNYIWGQSWQSLSPIWVFIRTKLCIAFEQFEYDPSRSWISASRAKALCVKLYRILFEVIVELFCIL